MTWRQVRVLIQHLPPESATMTALRNSLSDGEIAAQAEGGKPEEGRWSQLEQLVAVVADRIARVEYVLRCVNTEKKRDRPPPPEPIRRPGAAPPKPKSALTEAGANALFELINGGAA
jgi:hypothetical protein